MIVPRDDPTWTTSWASRYSLVLPHDQAIKILSFVHCRSRTANLQPRRASHQPSCPYGPRGLVKMYMGRHGVQEFYDAIVFLSYQRIEDDVRDSIQGRNLERIMLLERFPSKLWSVSSSCKTSAFMKGRKKMWTNSRIMSLVALFQRPFPFGKGFSPVAGRFDWAAVRSFNRGKASSRVLYEF